MLFSTGTSHFSLGAPQETGLTISNYIRELLSLKEILVNIFYRTFETRFPDIYSCVVNN